jgi:hypothetical protein
MLALAASIHVLNTTSLTEAKTWMIGTSPTMTAKGSQSPGCAPS